MVGQFFDADYPSRWVIFARRFTYVSPHLLDCYQVETVKKFSVPASVRLFFSGNRETEFPS